MQRRSPSIPATASGSHLTGVAAAPSRLHFQTRLPPLCGNRYLGLGGQAVRCQVGLENQWPDHGGPRVPGQDVCTLLHKQAVSTDDGLGRRERDLL